jgi:cell division protein FtsX
MRAIKRFAQEAGLNAREGAHYGIRAALLAAASFLSLYASCALALMLVSCERQSPQRQALLVLSGDEEADRLAVIESLSVSPLVEGFAYVAPLDAMLELEKADSSASFIPNTFSPMVRVTLSAEANFEGFKEQASALPGVKLVSRGGPAVDFAYSYGYYALIGSVLAALALLLRAAKLQRKKVSESIKARSEECRILKAFGATARYIKAPFAMETLNCGLAALFSSLAAARMARIFAIGLLRLSSFDYQSFQSLGYMGAFYWFLAALCPLWLGAFLVLARVPDPSPAFPEIC